MALPVTNKLRKDDGSMLSAAQQIAGTLQEQASKGEVDMALIEQLTSTLGVGSDAQAVSSDSSASEQSSGDSGSSAAHSAASGHGSTISTPSSTSPNGNGSSEFEKVNKGRRAGDLAKGEGQRPASANPPVPQIFIPSTDERTRELVPGMIDALEGGSLRKAQNLVKNEFGNFEPQVFDSLVNMALHTVMNQMGLQARNLRKIHAGATMGLDDLAADPNALHKSITAGDIPGIYLMKLVKLMLPLYAGLVKRLPADTPTTGADKAQWRAQIGFQNVNYANLMSVAEAAIGDAVNESFLTFAAFYRDIAQNDKVTLKAQAASRGYDDPLQVALIRLLTIVLSGQERKVGLDNSAVIGRPASVAGAGSGSGTLGNADDKFIVSALTYRGLINPSTGTTGADVIGESDGRETAAVNLSAALTLTLTWPAVAGAVAYNVYYDVHGAGGAARHYLATVKVNKYVTTALSTASNHVPNAADNTANAYGYEGLNSWAFLSTVYGNAIPNKVTPTDLAGAGLTTGSSGINEFDALLESMWTNWQISPSMFIVSPKGASKITDKIMGLNNALLYRIEVAQERGQVQGGAMVTGYVNKFAPYGDGTQRYVEILAHPYWPDGTCTMLCESIPYPLARESRGFARDVLIPYTYFPLAQSDISYPFTVTESETVECFHPAVQTGIQGIDWTL